MSSLSFFLYLTVVQQLHPITLKFNNVDLERHYYAFFNDDMALHVTLCVVISAVMFLVYIPLDFSYPKLSDNLVCIGAIYNTHSHASHTQIA